MSVKYFVMENASEEACVAGDENEAIKYVESYLENGSTVDNIEVYKVNIKDALKIQMTLAPVAKISKA